uniref:Uncharacterized protein TCIL3000_9_1460 n=1 Tax=Trypanosoma congolense (strain IL3000) TaxID=1068625 RepID=G0UTN5_TRYCI|nr:unnamed protein product [Trypanosoma congolense IL3000]
MLCRVYCCVRHAASSWRYRGGGLQPIEAMTPPFNPPRRFPVDNISVDSSPGSRCELNAKMNSVERTATGGVGQLNPQLRWLRHNLTKREPTEGTCSDTGKMRMPEGDPSWPRYHFSTQTCSYIYDPPNESKLAFLTENYCRLCHEPVEAPTSHCAWWDHVTQMAALRLTATYSRRWDVVALMREVQQTERMARFILVERPHPFYDLSTETDPLSMDLRSCYVFEKDAVARRSELRALLRLLCTTATHNGQMVLRKSSFVSPNGSPSADIGERTFRAFISELITPLLPPMGPEPTTRLQQRCWGRKNLEIMFDLLGLEALRRLSGVSTAELAKAEKAIIMRQIFYELATVLAECDARELSAVDRKSGEISDDSKHVKCETQEHVRLLVELALRRLSFELVYCHTMVLMERVWRLYEDMGYPSGKTLEEGNFC